MLVQLIPTLATILVALIGFIAVVYTNARSNSQALAVEKLKYEREKVDRQLERGRALLEELCSLCYQVEREIATNLQIPEQIKNAPPLPVTISEPTNRMKVIVNLYFRELKTTFDEYGQRLYALQTVYYQYYEQIRAGKASQQITQLAIRDQTEKMAFYKSGMEALVEQIAELAQKLN